MTGSRQFRFSFGKLLILMLLLLGVGRFYDPIAGWQDRILHPVLEPSLAFLASIRLRTRGFFDRYFFLLKLPEENERLQRESTALRAQLADLELKARALENFQAIEKQWKNTAYTLHPAQLISYDAADPALGIFINQGSDEGIQVGQVVVALEGLVGLVQKTYSHSSKLLLLVNPQFSVDAELLSSGIRGILRGYKVHLNLNRDYWMTRLEYLGSPEKIQEGESVITSGLDKVFPKGLLIGKIQKLKKDEKGMFISAEVLPEVDFSKLSEVMVMIP